MLYDDQLLSTVFTDITNTYAIARPSAGGDQIEGTVDLAASTCSFTGMVAGRYLIDIYLNRDDPASSLHEWGDLRANLFVEVVDPQGSIDHDFDLRFTYRVVSPVDSTSQLSGSGTDCTAHPSVTYPITFTIERVPRATSYRFIVFHDACPEGNIGFVELDSNQPSIEIEWGTANEDVQRLAAICRGASGKALCVGPQIQYSEGSFWDLSLRNRDSSGRAVHESEAVVIPAVAGTPGAHGTYWSSAVSVANLMTTDRQVLFTYTPRDSDGLTSYTSTPVMVQGSSQLSWSDVLGELFSTTGAGALEIRGEELIITSRTSTPSDEEGSYGQGIPPIQPNQLLSLAGTASAKMGGVEEGPAFRTNLGLCEVWGEPATVVVVIRNNSMTEIGRRTILLQPYENTQINRVVSEIADRNLLSDGMVTVTVTAGAGRVGAYLSLVDNGTGDPTFIAIAPQEPTGG